MCLIVATTRNTVPIYSIGQSLAFFSYAWAERPPTSVGRLRPSDVTASSSSSSSVTHRRTRQKIELTSKGSWVLPQTRWPPMTFSSAGEGEGNTNSAGEIAKVSFPRSQVEVKVVRGGGGRGWAKNVFFLSLSLSFCLSVLSPPPLLDVASRIKLNSLSASPPRVKGRVILPLLLRETFCALASLLV